MCPSLLLVLVTSQNLMNLMNLVYWRHTSSPPNHGIGIATQLASGPHAQRSSAYSGAQRRPVDHQPTGRPRRASTDAAASRLASAPVYFLAPPFWGPSRSAILLSSASCGRVRRSVKLPAVGLLVEWLGHAGSERLWCLVTNVCWHQGSTRKGFYHGLCPSVRPIPQCNSPTT